MTNTPVPAPSSHIPRSASLLLRWTACVVVIAGVFFVARHQDAPGPGEPAVVHESDSRIEPFPKQGGDVLPEGFEEIVEQVLAPLEDLLSEEPFLDEDQASANDEAPGAAWSTHSGDGANGTSWSVELPAAWSSGTLPTGRYVAGPDEASPFFTLESHDPTMSFEDVVWAHAYDLPNQVHNASKPTLIPMTDHPAGPAYEVTFDYDHPAGFRSQAVVVIVDAGDAYYVITVESPLAEPGGKAQTDTIVQSLSINRRS